MKQRKRIAAFVLAAAMVFSTLPLNVLAVETPTVAAGLCEHHPEHIADCGYTEGTEGTPCNHEHNEDCYTLVTECVHEHTEDCYPAESVSDNTDAQSLDLSGLSVQVNYNDNTSETLTGESGKLTTVPAQGTVLTVAEHNGKKIEIHYGGKKAQTNPLTVDKAEQEALSIIGAPSKIYKGSSFTLQTSGGSGEGAITWSVVSGPATVDANGAVTVTDIGEFQIKAVKAEDAEYNRTEALITLTAVKKSSSGGGSSSSGDASSDDREDSSDKDSNITNRPDKNNPSTPTTGQTTTVKPGINGNANINESTVQQAINKATAAAKKNGSTTNGIAVVVPVNVGDVRKDVQRLP